MFSNKLGTEEYNLKESMYIRFSISKITDLLCHTKNKVYFYGSIVTGMGTKGASEYQ